MMMIRECVTLLERDNSLDVVGVHVNNYCCCYDYSIKFSSSLSFFIFLVLFRLLCEIFH